MTFRFKRDAEAYERKKKGEQEEIRRGLRGLPPPAKPFEDICSYWIDHRAVQKRSGHHDESIIRAHLRPAFGALMLHEISPIHFDKFIVERPHVACVEVALPGLRSRTLRWPSAFARHPIHHSALARSRRDGRIDDDATRDRERVRG